MAAPQETPRAGFTAAEIAAAYADMALASCAPGNAAC
jgi:hypothetical protein